MLWVILLQKSLSWEGSNHLFFKEEEIFGLIAFMNQKGFMKAYLSEASSDLLVNEYVPFALSSGEFA